MEITFGEATKLLDNIMVNYSQWHTERSTRKKVPTDVLVDRISELNDNFAVQNNGLGFSLEQRLMKFCQKNAYNDELVVQYEGQKEEPIPPELDLGDFCPIKFSPFD